MEVAQIALGDVPVQTVSGTLLRTQMLPEIGAAYLLQQLPNDRLHSVQTYCSFPGKIELSHGTWLTILSNLKTSLALVCE